VYRIIGERRESGVEREDLLSLLLGLRDDEGAPMPDRQLRDEVVTLFIGGFETTSIGLSWALHVLASQPEVDRRVREELDREVGDRRVTGEDLPRLVVMDAFVKETLRLHSPAWAIGREATESTEICGHRIGAGTTVIVPIHSIHRDARWYRDPEQFRIDRWLGEEAKTIPKLAWIPFGAGPRVCIGEGFARMEMSLLLATLLRRLRFETVGDPPTPRPAFLLRPKEGVRLKVCAP
jgi:cytochrome P450